MSSKTDGRRSGQRRASNQSRRKIHRQAGMGTGKRGGVLVVLGEEREDIRMEKAKNAENEHLVFKTSEVNLEIHRG